MSGDRADRSAAPDPERMEVFIEAMTPPGPAHLQGLEQEALSDGVPIIRPQTQNLIRFFLSMNRPASILEIGTAVGFYALFMQHYAPAQCEIITIEKDHGRAEKARENFKKYGRPTGSSGKKGITLVEGDAALVLSEMKGEALFDLIFMDAAKGQYIRFLPDAVRLLTPGGLLITDNILQEGEVLSSRFAVTRRNRTIHARMRTYIHALMEEPQLETLLLPTGDGAAVSLRKGQSHP